MSTDLFYACGHTHDKRTRHSRTGGNLVQSLIACTAKRFLDSRFRGNDSRVGHHTGFVSIQPSIAYGLTIAAGIAGSHIAFDFRVTCQPDELTRAEVLI